MHVYFLLRRSSNFEVSTMVNNNTVTDRFQIRFYYKILQGSFSNSVSLGEDSDEIFICNEQVTNVRSRKQNMECADMEFADARD